MVERMSDEAANEIARAAYDLGQMSWLQYTFPGTMMPNEGIYFVGRPDPIDPGFNVEMKYLIAWRDKWIAFDLTVPGQSQTEVGVYLDAIKEGLAEAGGDTLKLITFAALAVGAYYIVKLVKD